MSKEMTPKEALDFLVNNLPVEAQQTTSIYHTAIRVLLQSITELDELKRDVKRFMELEEQDTYNSQEEYDEFGVLYDKLMKTGKEE